MSKTTKTVRTQYLHGTVSRKCGIVPAATIQCGKEDNCFMPGLIINYNTWVGVGELDSSAAVTHRSHGDPAKWRGGAETDHLRILLVQKGTTHTHTAFLPDGYFIFLWFVLFI